MAAFYIRLTSPAAPLQSLTDHCGFRLGALKLSVKLAGLSGLSPALSEGFTMLSTNHMQNRLGQR